MSTLSDFLQNPWIAAVAGGVSITGLKYVADVFISSMEAPTRQSSPRYRYWFKVLNKFAANWRRAEDTSVERSPNWIDAVAKATHPPHTDKPG
jgi:hypothetical protein